MSSTLSLEALDPSLARMVNLNPETLDTDPRHMVCRSPSKKLSPLLHPVPKTTPEDSEAVFTPQGDADSPAGLDDDR
jgi:hypothetical protein